MPPDDTALAPLASVPLLDDLKKVCQGLVVGSYPCGLLTLPGCDLLVKVLVFSLEWAG